MKTRQIAVGLLIILMLALPQSSQSSVTRAYDFANGMGTDFVFKNPTGLFTLDDSHGELRLSKSTDSLSIFSSKVRYKPDSWWLVILMFRWIINFICP